jgi:hypothetical protein
MTTGAGPLCSTRPLPGFEAFEVPPTPPAPPAPPAREAQWPCASTLDAVFLAEIDQLAQELSVCFDDMSPRAKAHCIRLGHTMADLRNKLRGGAQRFSHVQTRRVPFVFRWGAFRRVIQ